MRTAIALGAVMLAYGAQAAEFCEGYADGYESAWYMAIFTPPPMPVMCPLPAGPEYDSYDGGYAQGYADGTTAQEEAELERHKDL